MNLAVAPGSQPTPSASRFLQIRTEYRSAAVQLGGSTVGGPAIASSSPIAASSEYEEVFRITGALPSGYWLHYAIPVYVRLEGSEFVATQPQLAIMAFGDSPGDAILNLRADLVEHYERLLELGDRLGPQLARQRDFMRKLFTGRDA